MVENLPPGKGKPGKPVDLAICIAIGTSPVERRG